MDRRSEGVLVRWFVPWSSYSRLLTISVGGEIEHVSPRRKLDTDCRFSTTTTTVTVAARRSPLLSLPPLQSGARLLSTIAERGGRGARGVGRGRASGVWGKKERGERREGEVLAGRKSAVETQTVPDQKVDARWYPGSRESGISYEEILQYR